LTLGLHCAPAYEIGLFGSCFFFGYLCSCLVFPPLADLYGRKPFVIGVCVEQAICLLALLYPPVVSPFSFYVIIFFFGASGPLKNMIAYTHLMEFLPDKVTEASGLLFFLDDFVQVISPLLLMYVTKDTDLFLWIGLFMNILPLLGFLTVYIPESTKYLLEKGRYNSALNDIEHILRFNKSTPAQA